MTDTVWRPDGSAYQQGEPTIGWRAPFRIVGWKKDGAKLLLAVVMSMDEARKILAENRSQLAAGEKIQVRNAPGALVLSTDPTE
jgi:hypothetical protein